MPRPIARDPVLLLKLTPGVSAEGRSLARRGAPLHVLGARSSARQLRRAGVVAIRDAARPDEITVGRRTYDLSRTADRAAFAAAIGLRGAGAAHLCGALERAGADARDELAGLARALAAAERGKISVRRLVISGHAAGGDGIVRGNQPCYPHDRRPFNGTLTLAPLRLVVAAFPRAAAQVEHLMLAACFSAYAPRGVHAGDPLQAYRALFPRLRSVTAYADRAPRSDGGAGRDLRRWERATRAAAAPRREQVFGRCIALPRTKAQLRRAGGVVLTDAGPQRCAYGAEDPF